MSRQLEVSVIIPTWNRPQLLARALGGVADQSSVDFECIVVDDGSSRENLVQNKAVLAELDERFRLLTSDRSGTGPGAARNRGILAARGKYVAFIDDDDYWIADDHLSTAVAQLDQTECGFYFCNMSIESDEGVNEAGWFSSPLLLTGRVVSENPTVYRSVLKDLLRALRSRYIQIGSIVTHLNLAKGVLFWEQTHFLEDLNFILRCLDRAEQIFYRADPAVMFNVQPRERAYSRVDDIERMLAQITASQHLRTTCRRSAVRRSAKDTEAWSMRVISDNLLDEGHKLAGLSFAWQALALRPSPGSAFWLARCMARSLVSRRSTDGEESETQRS